MRSGDLWEWLSLVVLVILLLVQEYLRRRDR